MPQKSRSQLQGLFTTGATPSQQDFSDFIESTLNIKDDGLEKLSGADNPLKIKAQGTDEKLLDFYAGEAKTWSINQKPDGNKVGLNISNSGASKLFIASSNGNVGLSIDQPTAKLHIQQTGNEDALRIDDELRDTTPFLINKDGNVGIGTSSPREKLEVNGNLKITGTISGNIDTVNINSGTLAVERIPNLSADKITAGTIAPTLTASANSQTLTALTIQPNFSVGTFTNIQQNALSIPIGSLSFGTSTRQMISLFSSDYGMGVQASTFYFRTGNNFAWYKGGAHNDAELNPGATGTGDKDKGTVQMVIKNGNVGIGLSNPTKGKLVVSGQGSEGASGAMGYLNSSGAKSPHQALNGQATNFYYSIWSENKVAATEFNAFSDSRIKSILGVSDCREDLEILSKLMVTNYTYIDTVSKGTRTLKKLIGQNVYAVYPQAVTLTKDFVPDIYAHSVSTVYDLEQKRLAITLEKPHKFKIGETIRVIGNLTTLEIPVISIPSEHEFIIVAETYEEKVFVYGRQVDDFHLVDYESIAMLNVSATQELIKLFKNLQLRLERLEHLNQTYNLA
ncbi:hypothetical protein [Nostoc sp.]|uniref:hypothetical protein n=1 Tax=Nostoc sp. TaxID=1180 RepID=UPI002FFA1B92